MLRGFMALADRFPEVVARGLLATAVAACADTTRAPEVAAMAGSDAGGHDGGERPNDSGEGTGPKSTCAITRAYIERCGDHDDLTCGPDGFDAWCEAKDKTTNSDAYRRAEARCLTKDHCDGAKRRACEYEHESDESPTPSQKALVHAYCVTCEPSDVAGCMKRSTTYDGAKGIESVPDIFIAAWELAADVVDAMRTKCTGAGLGDAGTSSTECAKAFGSCAADIYLAHLPECPR